MAYSAHRGTTGHVIGRSIIQNDARPAPEPKDPMGGSGLSNINVDFGDNGGVSVRHRMKPNKKDQDQFDPKLEQIHMFRDSQEAHRHIGGLLGIRMGSGEQKE